MRATILKLIIASILAVLSIPLTTRISLASCENITDFKVFSNGTRVSPNLSLEGASFYNLTRNSTVTYSGKLSNCTGNSGAVVILQADGNDQQPDLTYSLDDSGNFQNSTNTHKFNIVVSAGIYQIKIVDDNLDSIPFTGSKSHVIRVIPEEPPTPRLTFSTPETRTGAVSTAYVNKAYINHTVPLAVEKCNSSYGQLIIKDNGTKIEEKNSVGADPYANEWPITLTFNRQFTAGTHKLIATCNGGKTSQEITLNVNPLPAQLGACDTCEPTHPYFDTVTLKCYQDPKTRFNTDNTIKVLERREKPACETGFVCTNLGPNPCAAIPKPVIKITPPIDDINTNNEISITIKGCEDIGLIERPTTITINDIKTSFKTVNGQPVIKQIFPEGRYKVQASCINRIIDSSNNKVDDPRTKADADPVTFNVKSLIGANTCFICPANWPNYDSKSIDATTGEMGTCLDATRKLTFTSERQETCENGQSCNNVTGCTGEKDANTAPCLVGIVYQEDDDGKAIKNDPNYPPDNWTPSDYPRKFDECLKFDTAIGGIGTTPVALINSLLVILLSVSGGIALIIIISAGYKLMSSKGDPEAIQAAKDMLTSAIIGLLFLIFAIVILEVVSVDILQIPGFNS